MHPRPERRAKLPDGVPIGLYRTAPDGTILDVNQSLVEMLGYSSRQALLALKAAEFYVEPADHAHIQGLMAQRGVLRNHETRVRRSDGRPLWVELSLRALDDARGHVLYEGAVVDVTDRKLAEEALWTSERHLRLFVEQVPAVLWGVDRELIFTLSLGTGLAAIGLRPNEVVGMPLAELFGADDPRHPVLAAHHRCLRGEALSYDVTFARREFRCYIEPWRETDGNISGVVGVALDVTDHQRLEQSLRFEVARRDAVLSALDDGLLVLDAQAALVTCNPAFLRMWGLSQELPPGMPGLELSQLLAPRLEAPPRCLSRLADPADTGESVEVLRLTTGVALQCRTRPLSVDGRCGGRVVVFRELSRSDGA